MKKTIFILLLTLLFSSPLFSQYGSINEFVCTKDKDKSSVLIPLNVSYSNPEDGVIIFSTTIPNISFKISNGPKRLRKNSHNASANQYILSVQPLTEGDTKGVNAQFKHGYTIEITAPGYKKYELEEVFVRKAQEEVYYTIEPKRQLKMAKVAVRGKDNIPLLNANVEYTINGEKQIESANKDGIATLRFRDDKSFTSDKTYQIKISHQDYEDSQIKSIKAGDSIVVKLYNYKPKGKPNVALVVIKGHDGKPLEGARAELYYTSGKPVYADGKPYYELSKSNGDAPLKLDFDKNYQISNKYDIKVSHTNYNDVKWLKQVTRTEDPKNPYNVRLTNYNPPKSFNFWSYLVPGLGEFQADRKGEGVFVITSEALFVGGAGVSYLLSNNYKNTMNKSNVGIDEYNKALKQYNTMRGVNIACWSAVAVIYTIHVFRVASLSKKNKERHYAFMPTVMSDDQTIACGVNFSLAF